MCGCADVQMCRLKKFIVDGSWFIAASLHVAKLPTALTTARVYTS